MNLEQTLANKPLFYTAIDTNRMPKAYDACKNRLKLPPIIHIIGTNGKGSSGRFLALMLRQNGKSVGHYTSPHILEFNERFWIDGQNISNEALEDAHERLQKTLSKDILESLSYFEYATFLAAIVFEECDFVIMEAGLGGEWDATNVFPKILSIVTPIGLDHQDFLGDNIQEIATTKLRSITTTTILSPNQDTKVQLVAKSIAKEREILLLNSPLSNEKTKNEISQYCKKYLYPQFLQANIELSFSAAKLLHVSPNIKTLLPLDLRARFEWVGNVLLDCGHNPMAATALKDALGEGKYIFIYNAYEDKDIESVLKILYPKIESLHVIPFRAENRPSAKERIFTFAKQNGIEVKDFDFTLESNKTYIVFGSFGVVEAFLKGMYA